MAAMDTDPAPDAQYDITEERIASAFGLPAELTKAIFANSAIRKNARRAAEREFWSAYARGMTVWNELDGTGRT